MTAEHLSSTFSSSTFAEFFIIGSAIVGILFGLINALMIMKIEVVNKDEEVMALKDEKNVN